MRPGLDAATTQLKWIVAILLLAVLLVYGPDVGHGFVKDDFVWIAKSRLSSVSDLVGYLHTPHTFFRPVVMLSFGLDRVVAGFQPAAYGWTNFALLILCVIGMFTLARQIGLDTGAAVLAAAIWVLNWHGINMAVIWVSGRTALLLVCFATFGATAVLRKRWLAAWLLLLLAMLSKEEAILLPAMLIAWVILDRYSFEKRFRRSDLGKLVGIGSAAWLVYFVLRWYSGALTPATAPPYYRLSFTWHTFSTNALQYLDRSATFAAIVGLLFLIVARPARRLSATPDRGVVLFGLLWWIAGFGITVFLPVRSSLYACLPSVGTALIVATLIASRWPALSGARRRAVVTAGLALPFLLWPVYHLRNQPQVRQSDLSRVTIATLQEIATRKGTGTTVVLDDDRSARPSLDDAFGTILQSAADLMVRPAILVWMDPPPKDAGFASVLRPPERPDVRLKLIDGTLTFKQLTRH